MKIREKSPIGIAFQWWPDCTNIEGVCGGCWLNRGPHAHTANGIRNLAPGCWIITWPGGVREVRSDADFRKLYEPAP